MTNPSTPPPAPRVLDRDPATLPTLLRAALAGLPVLGRMPGLRRSGDTLPDLVLTRHDVAVDRSHVAAYAQVCGYPLGEALPPTYPHVLAFGLHMAVLTDRAFPFPAVGLVHVENSITQLRPIQPNERLQLTVRAEGLREHARGRLLDLRTEVHSAGEPVWQSTSTLLRRGAGGPTAPGPAPAPAGGGLSGFAEVRPSGAPWRLPGDLGRRYAAVSGDHNPIHLYRLTARALGFPRPIAHGMWSLARCVAALQGRLPGAVRIDVAFKKPVLLPGSVQLCTAPDGHGYAFALSDPRTGAPHLRGRTVPA